MISYCKEYKQPILMPLIAAVVFTLVSAGKVYSWRHDASLQNNVDAEPMLWYEDIFSLPASGTLFCNYVCDGP